MAPVQGNCRLTNGKNYEPFKTLVSMEPIKCLSKTEVKSVDSKKGENVRIAHFTNGSDD